MRSGRLIKYLFLSGIAGVGFSLSTGCLSKREQVVSAPPPVFTEPISFDLHTDTPYRFNPITGDSIAPILSVSGKNIITGRPFRFNGDTIPLSDLQKKLKRLIYPVPIPLSGNVTQLPLNQKVKNVDTAVLKHINWSKSIDLPPGNDKNILSGHETPLSPKPVISTISETKPIKVLPLRTKDHATEDIQYLDVGQGLPFSYIYDVFEDSRGNMWFATDGFGICKYDGNTITIYSSSGDFYNEIVNCIEEDKLGRLWVAKEKGLSIFDGTKIYSYSGENGFPGTNLTSIYADHKGAMWIGTASKGVFRFDGNTITRFSVKDGLPSETVLSTLEDHHGNLWFGTYKGVAIYNGDTFIRITKKDGLTSDIIKSLVEDKSGNIWMGSYFGGVSKFDGQRITQYTKEDGLSDNSIYDMKVDQDGIIWIGTAGGGLNKFDGKRFYQFNLEQGASNSKVKGISEDKNGNIWFATQGGGISVLRKNGFNYNIPQESLQNSKVRPICMDSSGHLWFGTEEKGVGMLSVDKQAPLKKRIFYFPNQLSAEGQRSMTCDHGGNIWIGTNNEGIYKLIPSPATQGPGYILNFNNKSNVFGRTVLEIKEDSRGAIWIGGKMPCCLIKINNGMAIRFTEKDGLPGIGIFSVFEDKNGILWIGTERGGLCRYDGTTLTNYTAKEGFFGNSITAIIQDHDNGIWLATVGAGLCHFDGKRFSYITEKQGLSNNNVWSLQEDSLGQIWAGTDNGLNIIKSRPSKYEFGVYRYGIPDGLRSPDFNLHSVCIDKENRIWWGTGKGVVSTDLRHLFLSKNPRSLQVNTVEINDGFYDFRNIPDSLKGIIGVEGAEPFTNCPKKLRLDHKLNNLRFHFSSIDGTGQNKIRYTYRMLGLNEAWNTPTEETFADYRNLMPGFYEFQVSAIGESQNWSAPFGFSFRVLPAWWQTWWFKAITYLFAALTVLFISRLIYLSRLRKQRVAMEKQMAIQLERQRISAEMHDDIGAGLSGVRLLTEMTKNKLKESGARGEIDKIYQSVGEISAKMKEVIWSLNAENDNLAGLINYLQAQARQILEHYPGKLSIKAPDNIPEYNMNGEARRHIYLAIKEALNNIIKHAGASLVSLTISCDQYLVIELADNGVGFSIDKADNGGNGLRNMERRMKAVNGMFMVKNENGLVLTFKIPLV